MGDLIYPAIYLHGLSLHITPDLVEKRVGQYMNAKILKITGIENYYTKVAPPIEAKMFTSKKGKTQNAVVFGVHFPLDYIRDAMKGRQIELDDILFGEPDFGITRSETGCFTSCHDKDFYNHLKNGCGIFNEPLKLFTDDFWLNEIGMDPNEMTNIITIDLHKSEHMLIMKGDDNNDSMPTGLLQHTNCPTKNGVGWGTAIEFVTKLEAMQFLRWHNGNLKLTKGNAVRFNTSETETIPGIGFGVNGTWLDIRAEMKDHKYVRLTMVRAEILDWLKLEGDWKSKCLFCHQYYVLCGFHPDLSWIAATCGCQPQSVSYSWPGENFFRLNMAYDLARRHSNFRHKSNVKSSLTTQPLILMTKGLVPQYDSVEDYEKAVLGAEHCEFEVMQREVAEGYKLASIVSCSDELQKKNLDSSASKIYLYNIQLSLPSRGIWTPEKQGGIDVIKLIPVSLVPTDVKQPPSLTQLESLLNKSVQGRLEKITKKGSNSIIEIRLWVKKGFSLNINRKFYMIPRPPTGYIESIEKSIWDWKSFICQRECVTPREKTSIYRSIQVETSMPAYEIRIPVENNFVTNAMFHEGRALHLYYGIILSPDGSIGLDGPYDPSNTFFGVISTVERHQHQMDKVIVTAVIRCKSKDVVDGTMPSVSFWLGCDSKKDFLKNVDRRAFPLEKLIEKTNQNAKSNSEIAKNIITCPLKSFMDLRDFLLKKSHQIRVSHFIKRQIRDQKMVNNKDLFVGHLLNDSQKEAVELVVNNRIICVEGPPGCGKTWIICMAVFELMKRYERGGKILIVCPTNLCCDIVADTLHEQNKQQHGAKLIIRRMMAFGRETPIEDYDKKNNYVHSSIPLRGEYAANEKVFKLITERSKSDRNLLSEENQRLIEAHLSYVRDIVLDETDVIICTVDSAINKTIQDFFANRPDKLIGIVMDESNLVPKASTVPLLALNPKHFMMVGDYRQLKKCFSSRTATNACADVSCMQFFTATKHLMEITNHILLKEQYRFPRDLCKVISEWAYDNKLKSAKCVKLRDRFPYKNTGLYVKFPELLQHSMVRVTYDGNKGRETRDGVSYLNKMEARIVVGLVGDILNAGLEQKSITVLSIYKAQLKEIDDLLKERNWTNLETCTVDSFEGRQSPIVILSMVRSNELRLIGFLDELSRLTVGLSRPQHHLFYVSQEDTFVNSGIPGIEKLYEIMNTNNVPIIVK